MSSALVENRQLIVGLEHICSGKVRDSYGVLAEYQPEHPVHFVRASKRVSVFDFVLNAEVEDKDEILNALNIFWTLKLPGINHDLVAFGSAIDEFLPPRLRGSRELQRTGVVVRTLQMIPVECIARGCITGSAWREYQKGSPRDVFGHQLPEGLQNGSTLDEPIFTPTTKAQTGHDMPLTEKSVETLQGPELKNQTLALFQTARSIAKSLGFVLADTKLEFGVDRGGNLCLGDEKFTPDSSRYWAAGEYEDAQAQGKLPKSYDKQYVRDYALSIGISDALDTENPEHRALVAAKTIDPDALKATTRRYHEIFEGLTGMTLDHFQVSVMNIR